MRRVFRFVAFVAVALGQALVVLAIAGAFGAAIAVMMIYMGTYGGIR